MGSKSFIAWVHNIQVFLGFRNFKFIQGAADCKFLIPSRSTPSRFVVYKKDSSIPQEAGLCRAQSLPLNLEMLIYEKTTTCSDWKIRIAGKSGFSGNEQQHVSRLNICTTHVFKTWDLGIGIGCIHWQVMYMTTSTGTGSCAAGNWLVQRASGDDYVDAKLGYFELKGHGVDTGFKCIQMLFIFFQSAVFEGLEPRI